MGNKRKPILLALGTDTPYLMDLKRWLQPNFCQQVFVVNSFAMAERISQENKIDIFLVEGFGKEMASVFQFRFRSSMVCLFTDDQYLVCADPRVHCIQRPAQKRNAVSCIMNKWRQRICDEKRSALIKHHMDLLELYKTDPQEVEVMYMRLKRDQYATFESVALRHDDHRSRINFCITLQRGCPGGCVMCGTAKIKSHTTTLTCHEMAAQIAYLMLGYTAVGIGDDVVVAAHGGGDPRYCLKEYCNAVKIIEHTYKLKARYIATSIGGEATWRTMFSQLENYKMSYEISALSTDGEKRALALPATKHDLPLVRQVHMLADNAAKFGRLYKYRHLLTVDFNDSVKEVREIARLVRGTPCRVIIQKMETGCFPQFPKEVTDNAVRNFMYMLSEEGVDVCYNKNIGEGPVKCGMHITPQDRRFVL